MGWVCYGGEVAIQTGKVRFVRLTRRRKPDRKEGQQAAPNDELQFLGRLYVLDRGYAKSALLQKIRNAKSDFVVRLRDNTVLDGAEQRELSQRHETPKPSNQSKVYFSNLIFRVLNGTAGKL